MKTLFVLICVATLSVAYAQTQTNTSSSTTSSKPVDKLDDDRYGQHQDNVLNYEQFGTVTDYMPGAAITLDPGPESRCASLLATKCKCWGRTESARGY